MAWYLLVKRQTTALHFGFLAQGMKRAIKELNIIRSRSLEGISPNKSLVVDNGSYHLDLNETTLVFAALLKAAQKDPKLFLKVFYRFNQISKRWLRWLKLTQAINLQALNNKELLKIFEKHEHYYEIWTAVVTYAPFAVEHLYAKEFQRIVKVSMKKLEKKLELTHDKLHPIIINHFHGLKNKKTILNALTNIFEYSFELSLVDQKELSQFKIANTILENRLVLKYFISLKDKKFSFNILSNLNKGIANTFIESYNNFKWIQMWSYPFTQPYNEWEYANEISIKLREDPKKEIARLTKNKNEQSKLFRLLLESIDLTYRDKILIQTFNKVNYFRTWRMEILTYAIFMSLPILNEIERRGKIRKLLTDNDTLNMLPSEIKEYIRNGIIPSDLSQRKSAWALISGKNKIEIISGKGYTELRSKFDSVIAFNEKERGYMKHTNSYVGGKGENLRLLIEKGFRVPRYFIVSTKAYEQFLSHHSLVKELTRLLKNGYEQNEKKIKELFLNCRIPSLVEDAIMEKVEELNLHTMAVRSSATLEDMSDLSWAGMYDSFLYIKKDNLSEAIVKVWTSLFARRPVAYSLYNKINILPSKMAVIVQEMIDSDISGVVETQFSSSRKDEMLIEAIYGQGNPLVQGEITPDRYIFDKKKLHIIDSKISIQPQMFKNNSWLSIPTRTQNKIKIKKTTLHRICRNFQKIEEVFGFPVDIEFAIKGEQLLILQTRPITGLGKLSDASVIKKSGRLILHGFKGRMESVVQGRARIMKTPDDSSKLENGDILVIEVASPPWDSTIKKASGLITDEGGVTSHAIRTSNEIGIPVVSGTLKGTEIIKNGDLIIIDTTDPFNGKVYLKTRRINYDNNVN